jgi:hypothetical protein
MPQLWKKSINDFQKKMTRLPRVYPGKFNSALYKYCIYEKGLTVLKWMEDPFGWKILLEFINSNLGEEVSLKSVNIF